MVDLELEIEAIQKDAVKLLRLIMLYCKELTIPTNENVIIAKFECTEEAMKFVDDISDYFLIKGVKMISNVTKEKK